MNANQPSTSLTARALTFAVSVIVGSTAAIAVASAAVDSRVAPELRAAQVRPPVVRLEPVVVTISTSRFDAVRGEAAMLACASGTKQAARC